MVKKLTKKDTKEVYQTIYPDTPAGHTRRGAITEQKLKIYKVSSTTPRTVEGFVTLTELAAREGIQAQLARLRVLKAKIKRPKVGWRWPENSKELIKVRNALGKQGR